MDLTAQIAHEFKRDPAQVNTLLVLLEAGDLPVFIARYAKDETGGMPEALIRKIAKRHKHLASLVAQRRNGLEAAEQAGALTPELKARLEKTDSKTELEDLAAPFRPKKNGKGQGAIDNGLKPLADRLWTQEALTEPLEAMAKNYFNGARSINTTEQVLDGVRAILAERIAADTALRRRLRKGFETQAHFVVKPAKSPDEIPSRYTPFLNFSRLVKDLNDNELATIRRGVKRKLLKTTLEVDDTKALQAVLDSLVKTQDSILRFLMEAVATDAYHQALKPMIENDIRQRLNEAGDRILADNHARLLHSLLIIPPVGAKALLLLEGGPEYRFQAVLLDAAGNLLKDLMLETAGETSATARETIKTWIAEQPIQAVVPVAGLYQEACEAFWRGCVEAGCPHLPILHAADTGAEVFATSDLGKLDFPQASPSVRRLSFIGRRVQDPLATLTRLDPMAIVTGRAQKESDHNSLSRELNDVITSIVAKNGTDLNTAPEWLLAYVPGLDAKLAAAIVAHRTQNGALTSRAALGSVPSMTPSALKQAIGFVRVFTGANALDTTPIHPRHEPTIAKITEKAGKSLRELIANPQLLDALNPDDFVSAETGRLALGDIAAALRNAGKPARSNLALVTFEKSLKAITDLTIGQVLPGRISYLTEYGAFVQVGLKNDGLVHKTEISEREIKDHTRYLRVGQAVYVKVLKIDTSSGKYELSIKQAEPPRTPRPERVLGRANAALQKPRPPVRHYDRPQETRTPKPSAAPRPPRKVFGTLAEQFKALIKKP